MRKKVSFTIDNQVYDEYSKRCKKEGLVMSKQIENFMIKDIKNKKWKLGIFGISQIIFIFY